MVPAHADLLDETEVHDIDAHLGIDDFPEHLPYLRFADLFCPAVLTGGGGERLLKGAEPLLELVLPVEEPADHPEHRIGHGFLVFRSCSAFRPGDPSRDPDNRCTRRHGADDHGSRPHLRALPDPYRAEDYRTGTDDHVLFNRGVALDILKGSTPEHHAHVDEDIVADFRSFSYDDPHAVVDDHAAPDLRPGMDLDTGQEPADMGDEPGPEFQVMGPEPVRPAVEPEGMEPGVAEEDLEGGAGGGILGKDCPDIFPEAVEDHDPAPLPGRRILMILLLSGVLVNLPDLEEFRTQVPLPGVRQDDDNGLACILLPCRELERCPCRCPAGDADEDALLSGHAPCGCNGIPVGHADHLVQEILPEHIGNKARPDPLDLMRARLASREDGGCIGFYSDGPERRPAGLDHFGYSRDGPAGPHTGDDSVHLPVRVPPDLLCRCLPVDGGVGRVPELLGDIEIPGVLCKEGLGLSYRPLHPLFAGREDEFGAEGFEELAPLDAHRL